MLVAVFWMDLLSTNPTYFPSRIVTYRHTVSAASVPDLCKHSLAYAHHF